MPTELINLELDELSLVPKGANQMAKAPIFKSFIPNGEDMTDTIEKMDPAMDAKIKDYMKAKGVDRKTAAEALMKSLDDVAKLQAEVERLRKAFLDEGYTIKADAITKAAPEEFVEYGGEKIAKSAIPTPILKALEEAEVAKADAVLTKAAEEKLPHFDLAVAKGLMSAVAKMSNADALMTALEAADKAFEDKMTELGKSATDGEFTSPKDKVEHLVKEYQKSHNVSYHTAYAEVVKTAEGKALITKTYKDKE
jgi:hypothetical protein